MCLLVTPNAPEFKPIGWTALHLLANERSPTVALCEKRAELAQLMLDKRANPMPPNARGTTPLHTAAATSNVHVAEVLLKQLGVEVIAKNKDNKHPWGERHPKEAACASKLLGLISGPYGFGRQVGEVRRRMRFCCGVQLHDTNARQAVCRHRLECHRSHRVQILGARILPSHYAFQAGCRSSVTSSATARTPPGLVSRTF